MEFEETVSCPFDVSHRILPSRLQYHLVRCKRSHPNVNLKICPFNSTHYLKADKFSEHLSSCPFRASTEKMIYPRSSSSQGGSQLYQSSLPVASSSQAHFEDEEDWENELVDKSYDPMSKCLKSDVPLIPRNLTKSQRKVFREEEIDRIRLIKAEEEAKKALISPLRTHQ